VTTTQTTLDAHHETTDDIKQRYRYWRIRTLYGMFTGYVVFYFTRKSFTFVMPSMISDMHMSMVQVGLISSLFYIIYGISKFVNGMISDRSSPRYFMAIGLFATGVVNIFFGFSSSLWMLTVFWMINAFFQGWGWPPCARLLTHWYSIKERGRWWAVWNTSHNVGGALIPLIVAGALAYFGSWRMGMIIPGVIAIVVSFFVFNRLRDIPQKQGLPRIETFRQDYPPGHTQGEQQETPMWTILSRYIFKNHYIWLLVASYILIYIIRTALNDWGAVYLHQKGASLVESNAVMSCFEIGGFFGSLFAGWCSDLLFQGRRGPVNVLYALGIVFSIVAFWKIPGASVWLHSAAVFMIGFLVFGPQMLIGMAAAELSHRDAAGTSTGFLGLFGYLGAALSGAPIGYIIQRFTWQGFFVTTMVCSLLSILFLLPLWNATQCPTHRNTN
jgi:OPA family sugar phosphate sensor protein UhpC-like MFS transporter